MRRDLAAFEEEGGSDGGDVGHGHLVVLVLFQVRQQVPNPGVGAGGNEEGPCRVRLKKREGATVGT